MNLQTLLRPTNGKKTEPSDEVIGQIYSTRDYSKFKLIDSNREINENNLRRIKESFNEAYLMTIVIVNENFEIIDGQHRFNAAKENGNPVYYTIAYGYGIREVQLYNTSSKNWNRKDFLQCYVSEGKPAYEELDEFMKTFPDLGIQVSTRILSGVSRGHNNVVNGVKMHNKDFEKGNLRIKNATKAYINARKIMDFKEFYSGFTRTTFASALLPLFDNKVYDHKRMLAKLKVSPIRLDDCSNVEQYRLLLQKIYNWKARPDDRADFINV